MTTDAGAERSAYSEADYADNYPDGIERHYWTQARFRVVLDTLRRHGAMTGRILDIGAGRGAMVGWLREHSLDAWGVEPGAAPIEPKLRDYVKTSRGPESLTAGEREPVSDILLLDVLEHLEHPETLLGSLKGLFPNLRRVLVTVPARKELWSNYDERFGHYRRYDEPSLLELLEKQAGFSVLSCRYFFRALYPAIRVVAHLPSGRSTVMRPPRLPSAHLLLAKTLVLTDRLLPRSWYGSSLIAVARVS